MIALFTPAWFERVRSFGVESELPIFVVGVLAVALFVTYPFQTATVTTLAYLASLPFSWSAFLRREKTDRERKLSETADEANPASDGQP